MEQMTERDKARFWSKVKPTDYCWTWEGCKNEDGYGNFRHLGESLAHRISYQLIHGNISMEDQVLHSCDNPSCVNPDHLWIGNHQDNMKDKTVKGRSRRIGRSSKYRGVTWRSDSRRWRAYIILKKKVVNLGSFLEEESAAMAHDERARKEFGASYPFNFTDKWTPIPERPKEI